ILWLVFGAVQLVVNLPRLSSAAGALSRLEGLDARLADDRLEPPSTPEDDRGGRFAEARAALQAADALLHATPLLPGAAASAREVALLSARIAWAEGAKDQAEQWLATALRLDPEARLSPRHAPPELVARHEALQTTLLTERERWPTPVIELGGQEAEIEIDGVPGLRQVPPGEHLLLVYRVGHEPAAAWVAVEDPWQPPETGERIGVAEPSTEAALEELCSTLGLDQLLLAERRTAQLGLQVHACGRGLGPRWIGAREGLELGLEQVFAGPFGEAAPNAGSSAIALDDPWPKPGLPVAVPPDPGEGGGVEPVAIRPWYRKGWIWGTSAGVAAAIAAGVTAGVLLGGRSPGPTLTVDAGDFL
ncbi:MAG: hypothetical protein KC457_29855, partial [Myxococcales bacterium]|nr:hypothetical protein [Myxococcales bacterium]